MTDTREGWSSPFDRDMAARWHRYRPPARPSASEVRLYEELMRVPADTLLLGATPEIRSLAHRYGHRLTAVDMNAEVFAGLQRLVSPPGRESFVCANWLEMELGAAFDLVVGDGSINMLPPGEHVPFIERVAAHTRPGGLAALHVHLLVPPPLPTVEEVFRKCGGGPGHIYEKTRHYLCLLWADPETGEVRNAACWHRLQQLRAEGVISEGDFAALREILEFDRLSVFFIRPERFRELVAPYFSIEAKLVADDYASAWVKPLFLLRRQ